MRKLPKMNKWVDRHVEDVEHVEHPGHSADI